ncbi:MAG: hypothetical protein K9W43_03420 [Candidatus Thorarchaeota archaeon]|nr:hypothetical protein [Candidatus Thorarchaeota archaeon]
MSLTARELVQRIAKDAGCKYSDIAERVNKDMKAGKSLVGSVQHIAKECGLNPSKYKLDASKIASTIKKILREDYSQTLMISAVLAQMVESKGKNRLPPPAFFAFLEFLTETSETASRNNTDPPDHVDESTTLVIELTTSLVSVICKWSVTGIEGVSEDCPQDLRDLAKVVVRKTKLYQAGMWTCLSCGKIVALRKTHALLCPECDARLSGDGPHVAGSSSRRERHRVGYGQSELGEKIE